MSGKAWGLICLAILIAVLGIFIEVDGWLAKNYDENTQNIVLFVMFLAFIGACIPLFREIKKKNSGTNN